MGPPRSARQWRRLRDQVADEEPWCWLCGKPINYDLPANHPDSYHLDHIVPVAFGGEDVRENVHASHQSCNLSRGTGARRERLPSSRDW